MKYFPHGITMWAKLSGFRFRTLRKSLSLISKRPTALRQSSTASFTAAWVFPWAGCARTAFSIINLSAFPTTHCAARQAERCFAPNCSTSRDICIDKTSGKKPAGKPPVFVFAYGFFCPSAARSALIIGKASKAIKKLLTPCMASNGSPAIIQAIIPLKLSPNIKACIGA